MHMQMYCAYQIYILEDGAQKILAEGEKQYSFEEIQVDKQFSSAIEGGWQKSLNVADKFNTGGSIYREHEVTGFGLWIEAIPDWYEFWSDGGFSWEWFYKERGVVRVTMESVGELEEIKAIEFLSDVTMRLNNSWNPFSTKDTHYMVVKKGSILRFAP
jgi:hypothetical protein